MKALRAGSWCASVAKYLSVYGGEVGLLLGVVVQQTPVIPVVFGWSGIPGNLLVNKRAR